jgi:hypothetical protein
VETTNGIVEFGNLCYAMCAGYTQNDLVSCTPVCSIENFTATPGACDPVTFQYPVTINFNPGNITATNFEVYSSSNVLLGIYPIASLPVTIPNYPESILGAPNLNIVTIKINENNENCADSQTFTIPNCGIVTDNFSELLGTCFFIIYPVDVQNQGAIVTVNSDVELLQYINPINGSMPVMNYPISVTFDSGLTIIDVQNQAEFEQLIQSNCP